MSGILLASIGVLILITGYFTYGRLAGRIFGVSSDNPTPAFSRRDGVDYVPAKGWLVLFGHHFSSIAGAGPIVGPIIAIMTWGWAPAIAWVILGTIFAGGVHDFGSLMVSLRREGTSISDASEAMISRWAKIMFSLFVLLALLLVVAVFAVLAAESMVTVKGVIPPAVGLIPVAVLVGFLLYRTKTPSWLGTLIGLACLFGLLLLGAAWRFPTGPVWAWTAGLLVYAYIASVTPVQYLLQPRDYLSAFLLFAGLIMGYLGVFLSRPEIAAPAFTGFLPKGSPLWPMLFVTVACGAISGFHSLIASGTTSKQLASEAHAQRIGYGAMVAEGLLSVMVIVMVGAIGSGLSGNPINIFGRAYDLSLPFLGGYGGIFGVIILNAFILTTLDTATRIGRYIFSELTGIRNRWIATAIVIAPSAALAFTGSWKVIWPLFGSANQLTAALALLVITSWLLSRKKPCYITLIPAIFMLITTIGALLWQAWNLSCGLGRHPAMNSVLLLITLSLLGLSVAMSAITIASWARRRGQQCFKIPERRKSS
ncbi:MAG: carbon starvation protein A [candidate division WOR-3 bacterium]